MVAGEVDALVQLVDGLEGEAVRHGDGEGDLPRGAVHGVDVAGVCGHGLVAEVFERHVGQVEVDTLDEHVGADEDALVPVVEHGGVVAHSFERGCVFEFDIFGQVADESELA